MDLHDDGITYTVWISFAEIYNENIYDLFQKVPEVGARAVDPDSLNSASESGYSFDDQKLKEKKYSRNLVLSFFKIKNCNLLMSKLKEKPSALIRAHLTFKKLRFIYFFLCLWVILALLDPDPDCESGSGFGSGGPIESRIRIHSTGRKIWYPEHLNDQLGLSKPRVCVD